MANESALWKWMKAVELGPKQLHMSRVENSAAAATPDVEGQYGSGGHFHVELKVLHDQKNVGDGKDFSKETGILKFQVGQREWGEARWKVGGASWVLCEGFRGDLYLIPGAFLLALPRIGTVKSAFLEHLSYWSTDGIMKKPADRLALFDALRSPGLARDWVEERLQRDPRLRSASQPVSELAQALGLPLA